MSRCIPIAVALGLAAAAPAALAQKMHKCKDASGSVVFQQAPCGESPEEAAARAKERERLMAEEQRRKDEAARRKQEQIQKARERDKAYQQRMEEEAKLREKAREAERRIMEGTGQGGAPGAAPAAAPAAAAAGSAKDDAGLPDDVAMVYPGPWRADANTVIASAFATRGTQGCGKYRYRQRAGGGQGEFLVHCNAQAASRDYYFVWPQSGAVKGPVKF